MMVFTMFPVGVWAKDEAGETEDSAFQVGENLYSTLDEAMIAGDTITLIKDATFTAFTLSDKKTLTIDLMGHKLSSTGGADITVSGSAELTIQSTNTPGTLDMTGLPKANSAAITVKTASSVELNNVNYTTDGTGLFPQGDAATVTVEKCTLNTKGYCLGTNAGTSENYRVKITLSESTFNASSAEDAAGTAMYLNVPGTLEMDTCEVNGYMHGMFIRGGTATIKNSTITNTMDNASLSTYFKDRSWGGGNMVNLAALTLGDKSNSDSSSSYRYPTSVTLENTTVKMEGAAKDSYPAIYLYQMNDSERQVTLNITGDNGNYVGDISINNKVVDGETTANVSITGGTFADDVSEYVPNGYSCKKDGNTWVIEQLPYVAAIGDTQYYSLADAVAASKDGDTIEVLDDSVGRGIMVKASDGPKKVAIDFNGHTYTMGGPAVGSTGTESQAWHIEKGNTFILKDGTLDLLPEEQQEGNVGKMLFQNYCNLTLEDMTLDGKNLVGSGTYTLSNNCGTVNITGNTTIIAKEGGCAFDVCRWATMGYDQVNVTVNTTGVIDGKIEVTANGTSEKTSTLVIENGYFKNQLDVQTEDVEISITGGSFSVKPDASYLPEDYTTVSSGNSSYPYLVQKQESIGSKEEGTEVTVVTEVAKPSVDDSELNDLTDKEKNAVTTAAESATVSADVMQQESAAALEAVKDAVEEDSSMIRDAVNDVKEITQEEITAEDVTLYVQTYLNIIPTGYNTADKTLTLDITPMSRVVASTASSSDQIVLSEKDGPVNAVIVKETEKKLDIKDSVEMTIELPSDFIENKNAYVLHTKDSGKQYVYTGTVDGQTLTFTNPNGFSEFTVYASDPSVARVYAASEDLENDSGVGYMTLQDAVNAVKTGGTIIANQDGEATVSDSKSFTVIDNGNDIALFAGKNYRMEKETAEKSIVYTFTYRGGSSSSDDPGSALPLAPGASYQPGEPSDSTQPGASGGFVSDTTDDLTVNGTYQFRITSLDGTIPFLTVDNANFRVEFASQEGNDFFFKIHAQGAAGSTTVVSVNGVRLLTATVGGSAAGVISDTTAPFTVKKGETYQFRLTASERPSFAAGSASFTVEYAGQIGSDYFYKVYAAGNVGDGCGFYINGEASPVAVATIA